MLRGIRFTFSNSKYPLFRNFVLVFDFKAISDKDWIDEELFFKVEPTTLEFDYYGSKLFVFVFKVSSSSASYYLTYEFYESMCNGSITDIFVSSNLDLTVRVSKYSYRSDIRLGGGEFKIFDTFEKLMKYYEKYDEEESYEYEEESEESYEY